jgi:hypothetical protein
VARDAGARQAPDLAGDRCGLGVARASGWRVQHVEGWGILMMMVGRNV